MKVKRAWTEMEGSRRGRGVASDRGSFREGTFTSRWLSA
jgi:hypothetical protein